MKQKLNFFFCLVTIIVMSIVLYSCQSDDDPRLIIDPVEPYVTLSADGVPSFLNPTRMTRELFNENIVGRGWYYESSHEIKPDGTIMMTDFYQDMIGISPSHYYFDADSLTVFRYHDSQGYVNGGLGFVRYAYTYNEADQGIYVQGRRVLQLNPVGEKGYKYLRTVRWSAMRSDGTQVYTLDIFRRMTDKELEKIRQTYSANFTVNEDKQNLSYFSTFPF
ncbi:MAG: hypothetical protein ACOYJK_02410 [Prevotella sp.]